MKRNIILLGMLGFSMVYAQTHRVGINTETPKATLDVSRVVTGLPSGQVEGLLIPQLTQTQRNAMTKADLTIGLQIINTDKKCVEFWNGSIWSCSDGTQKDNHGDPHGSPSAAGFVLTQQGFYGVYKDGETLTNDNTVTFVLDNTGGTTDLNNINLSNAVVITNAAGGTVGVVSGQHSNVTVKAGRLITLTYTLQGTAKLGPLSAKMTYTTVNATASTTVASEVDPLVPQFVTLLNGERSIVSVYDQDYWPYSGPTTPKAQTTPKHVDGLHSEPLVDIQGKIPATGGIEVYIPIRVAPAIGHGTQNIPAFPGTEIPVSPTYIEGGATGQKIKLSWPAQTVNISTTYIKAYITAVGASDIHLKKLDFNSGIGQDYEGIKVGTFNYMADQGGGTKASFIVRLTPGIPDRRFAITTKNNTGADVLDHKFIYVPVKDPVTGLIWLNNNLGANYTNLDHAQFDPGQQAKQHNDINAFGSLFQFGRPADGHELVNWGTGGVINFKYGTTTTPTATYPPAPTDNKTVIPPTQTETNGVDITSMWFAGTSAPSTFPVTSSSTENNHLLCPYGFRAGYPYQLISIVNRTKATDDMKEFYVRLPSNRMHLTSRTDNGTYGFSPKLWMNSANRTRRYNSSRRAVALLPLPSL